MEMEMEMESTPRSLDLPQESDFRGISTGVPERSHHEMALAYQLEPHPRNVVPPMAPPTASERALPPPTQPFDLRTGTSASRPGHAPLATTIVLFAVVAALLGFIAWI